MRKKIMFITILFIFCGYYLFFLVFPIVLVGPPSAVYSIWNHDEKPHNISVEILDENNFSVFQKQYSLKPDEKIEYERQIKWYIPIPSDYISWSDGKYTFIFTVDNNISKSKTTEIWPLQTVGVWLFHQGYYDSEPVPIDIMISTF